MSRNIPPKPSVMLSTEEQALRKTENGKLIFTAYQNRNCSMLLRDDRLVLVSFFNEKESNIGAIYIGKIKNVAKNINACFVEIAKGEICFLPLQKADNPILLNRSHDGRLLQGDEILVQVERDAQKTKQASVTPYISLANEYFSITMGNTAPIRYSSKLSEDKKEKIATFFEMHQASIQEKMTQNNMPSFSLLARTKAGECETAEELLPHLYSLLEELAHLVHLSKYRSCFSCLKEATKPYESILQQHKQLYQEIITDNPLLYDKILQYTQNSGLTKVVRLYQDNTLSLSAVYSLKSKMEMALERRVWLKSGGYLVIEPTEALTVIDVNTGKYEAKKDAEDTYLKINMEAAEEIALQLPLRNLSGIIIVDFINMRSKENKANLMAYLKKLVAEDKIPTKVIDMTPLGLVEITRKKINPTLAEQYRNTTTNTI